MERKQVVIVKDSHVSMALKKHSRSDPRCKAMAWDQRLGPAKMGAGQAWHCLNRSCQSPQVAQVQPRVEDRSVDLNSVARVSNVFDLRRT
jgi:hypothetical protein